MTDKYDALVQELMNDHVHKTHPELGLVNPFSHPALKNDWNEKYRERLEVLNEKQKLGSKKLAVFYDYWPLDQLIAEKQKKKEGKKINETPFERAMKLLVEETEIGEWMQHNFVCFIKNAKAADGLVGNDALTYCLPYFLKLVDAQETQLMVITNFDVWKTLMKHYGLDRLRTWRETILLDKPVILPNSFNTKVIPLPHPGSHGQQHLFEAYYVDGYNAVKNEEKQNRQSLLVKIWRERLEKAGT